MTTEVRYKVRRVVSRDTPSYQLGHYEMTGKPGARRSVFKVLVHLGEHATPEAALEAWREDAERARSVGRDKTVARIEAKLRKLEGAISYRTGAR
jgi:cobalamin biosynthesis protein CobD/CbiB